MTRIFYIFPVIVLIVSLFGCSQRKKTQVAENEFSGSESCIECHQKFYDLWQPSYHAQAMMPVDAGFVAKHQLPDSGP
jgi:nitrate/TMAO reductase-like tetraheme cytochrome c subunit